MDDEITKDREIVLTAVRQNGRALLHAHDSLKRDPVIARAAVAQTDYALEYEQCGLRGDFDFMVNVVRAWGSSAVYLAFEPLKSEPLKSAILDRANGGKRLNPALALHGVQDPEVRRALIERDPEAANARGHLYHAPNSGPTLKRKRE